MGYPVLTFTPRGGSAVTCAGSGIATWVTSFEGGPNGNRSQSFTQGGRTAAVIHDVFEEYRIKMDGVRPSRSAAWRTFHAGLYSWWEHALAGGTFSFTMDSAQSSSTTLNGALAYTATSVTVVSTTGMTAGDWLYFEDAADQTKWARRRIASVDSGTTLTLSDAIGRPFATASTVRHMLYLPVCVCLDDEMPLIEKRWDMWEFDATIRTVRS